MKEKWLKKKGKATRKEIEIEIRKKRRKSRKEK